MTPFELAEPKTLREAVGLLDADDPTVRPIAGGTALMLMMKAGVFKPTKLVSLAAVKELVSIDAANGELKVGAMTPLAVLERSDAVKKHSPVITQHVAHAVQHPRAQRRDRRRRDCARRSAHGPAAGADGARRARRRDGTIG